MFNLIFLSRCGQPVDASIFLQLDRVGYDDDLSSHKTLGLIWHASTDQFYVKVALAVHPFTRRGLLSVLARLYDPLGIVAPYTLPAKLIVQRLAKQDYGWGTEIPEDVKSA